MATPQNYRVLQLEGQSYDGGNTNSQIITFPPTPTPTTALSAQPYVQSVGYTTANITNLQNAFSIASATGVLPEILFRNQSPYWITITYSASGGLTAMPPASNTASSISIEVGIPPYGLWIVPTNFQNPLTGVTGGYYLDGNQPVPPTTTTLYADVFSFY